MQRTYLEDEKDKCEDRIQYIDKNLQTNKVAYIIRIVKFYIYAQMFSKKLNTALPMSNTARPKSLKGLFSAQTDFPNWAVVLTFHKSL